MNIETKSSLVDISFELPSDWTIVLDTNKREGKSCVFSGVLVCSELASTNNVCVARFDSVNSMISIDHTVITSAAPKKIHFANVSASVAKLIKLCMKAFMQRYMEVKAQMSTSGTECATDDLIKKHFSTGKYSIYQLGQDGGSGGLVILIRDTELRRSKIIPGISLVECGEQFPIMIINMPAQFGAVYNIKFSCILGGYCIGTLNCLNNVALAVCKEKLKEYMDA
jgi:hypothetical protein